MLKECFVIQCFDGAVYDQRYRETFAAAIKEGGATPVRADETLGTKPVIEKIEAALRRSDIAFAEVSEDNPNVFLELGFALALGVPAVIVCHREKRRTLPFDIQHRPILFYSVNAESDFQKLRSELTKNIAAALTEAAQRRQVIEADADTSDLDAVKRLSLLQLLESDLTSTEGATMWSISKAMPSDQVSERMLALALTSLLADGLVEVHDRTDQYEGDYKTFNLTDDGRRRMMREYSAIMKEETARLAKVRRQPAAFDTDLDDDVPF